MAILKEQGSAQRRITEAQMRTPADGRAVEFDNAAALSLVVQDAERAASYIASQQYSLRWREIDLLYKSPRMASVFEGTTVTRANVSRFTVAKHVNSVDPQIRGVVFGAQDPPFMLRPKPGTTEEAIRVGTAVMSAYLEAMEAEIELGLGLFDAELMGTGIWKWGTETKRRVRKTYRRKHAALKVEMPIGGEQTIPTTDDDELEEVITETEEWSPWLEHRDPETVLVDPGLTTPDIRRAKHVTDVMYLDYYEIEDLRDEPDWDLPPEAELKALFFPPEEQAPGPPPVEIATSAPGMMATAAPRDEVTSADPLRRKLQVLERTDEDRIIAVLDKKVVIRNSENRFGCINYFSCNWWNVRRSFWGMGLGILLGQDQRVDQGLTNGALDMVSFACNPSYLRARGANVLTQQIRERLGGIIDVDGEPTKAFALKETPQVPAAAFALLQNSKAEEESASGANEILVQGQIPAQGRTSMGRTATGAGAMAAGAASRLQGPLDKFIDQVYEPWLYKLDELIRAEAPIRDLRAIVSDEFGEGYKFDAVDYMNARFRFKVLAGGKLAAKRAMAQTLPLMIQVFDNPQLVQQLNEINGEYVDVGEMFNMFMEASEWANRRDVVKKMTPEMLQRVQQRSNALQAKTQAQAGLADQKFQQERQLIDDRTMAKAGSRVLEETMLHAMQPEAFEGAAGGDYQANG